MDSGKIDEMAESIYLAVSGDIDSKAPHAQKASEIADWLADGDLTGNETVEQLAAEWREYDAPEETVD